VLLDNGMVGKNLLFGLQVEYLFGFNKKLKKNNSIMSAGEIWFLLFS